MRAELLTPAAIARAVRAYHAQTEADRLGAQRDRLPIERDLAAIARRIDRAADSYERGLFEIDELESRLTPLRAQQADLRARLALCDDPAPIRLHPKSAEFYTTLAATLETALDDEDAGGLRALLRASITRIDFHPAEGLGAFDLNIRGTLAELLGISKNQKTPHPRRCEVDLGAGTRSGRNLTPLEASFAA